MTGTAQTAGTSASAVRSPAALSVAAAAAQLDVSPTTIYRLVRRGQLAHARVGNSLRIPAVALATYLTERTSTTWAPADGRGSAGTSRERRPSRRKAL